MDQGTNVLGKFDAAGVPLASVEVPGAGLAGVAVDPYPGGEQGEVLAAGFSSGTVYRFSPGLVAGENLPGLTEPVGVAVDQAGDVFVAEWAGNAGAGKVLEFNAAGQPINAAGIMSFDNDVIQGLNVPQGVAVTANGETLYVATGSGTVQYSIAGASYTPVQTIDGESSTGVALDASGNVLSDDAATAAEYEPSGTPVARFGGGVLTGLARGIAVSGKTGQVYVPDQGAELVDVFGPGETPEEPTSGPASTITGTTAVLEGTLSSAGAGTSGYYFAYNTGPSCTGGFTTALEEATEGLVHAEVAGLEAHTTYTFCLVATNKYGSTTGQGLEFQTASVKPVVEGETFTQVGTTSATLTAQVNTENLPVTYYYQYTPEGEAPKQTPSVTLPASNTPTTAQTQLTGLIPAHEYRFHIVVQNTVGEAAGEEVLFRTLPVGIDGLPDDRASQMVTPASNQDANVYVPLAIGGPVGEGIETRFPFQVAADGSAVAYAADPTTAGFGQSGRGLGNQYVARRLATSGWQQSLLQPPGRKKTFYQGFSENLEAGVLTSGNGFEPLEEPLTREAPAGGYAVLYKCLASQGSCGVAEPGDEAPANPYHALFRVRPSNRTAIEFGTQEVYSAGAGEKVPVFAGGSEGFGTSLFEANDALPGVGGGIESELENDAKEEVAEGGRGNFLYSSVDGQLNLIDVSPSGKVVPNASFGSVPFSRPGHNPADFSGIISADGHRVYWSDSEKTIFVRIDGERTAQVSDGTARYWTSADNGRYAFYTENGGLYRFDIEKVEAEARKELVAPAANVLGVVGASIDGESVYFVAEAALESAASGEGISPQGGQPNLYRLGQDGKPVFIATLSSEDGTEMEPLLTALSAGKGEYGDWQPGLGQRTARVTDDGGAVVFMSKLSLPVVGFPKGYDNRALAEVYLYQAATNRLYCVSCLSSGEFPPNNFETEEVKTAAFVPISWSDTYLPQSLSEDGHRVFFDSAVPLVANDTNGHQDVYEWEQEGTGSCTSEIAINDGCIYLLSGGTSQANSWLIGASASGKDVFIVTRAQLASEDQNDAFDLYDEEAGGVVPTAPPVCSGSGCQGVPEPPPSFATPASTTFEGEGNFTQAEALKKTTKRATKKKHSTRAQKLAKALRACQAKLTRERKRCEASARARYGKPAKKQAKKSVARRTHHV